MLCERTKVRGNCVAMNKYLFSYLVVCVQDGENPDDIKLRAISCSDKDLTISCIIIEPIKPSYSYYPVIIKNV